MEIRKMNTIGLFLLIVFGISFRLNAQTWQYYQPLVIANGDTLDLAWTGGLNNPVFSNIELNFDGIPDLIVYEKAGKKILPFLQQGAPGVADWVYAPAYASAFPSEAATWIICKDFNCDGKDDLFIGNSTGRIKCYQNTSPTAGPLQFTLFANTLKTRYPFFTDLSYTITDLPALIDVDGDTDLDFLTFGGISTTVEWHRNYAIENYNRCDTFDFVLETDCWGHFAENQFNNNVTLNISCKGNTGSPKTLHSGSTILAFDADGNGTKEIAIGDISYNTLVFLTNGGTPQQAMMTAKDTAYPSNSLSADVLVFPAAYFVDINNDAKRDLVVAPFPENASANVSNVWYYENSNTDAQPVFQFTTDSLLNREMIDVGSEANITLFDENADGLYDLLIGNYLRKKNNSQDISTLTLFRNIGTTTQPSFSLVQSDYLQISTLLGNTIAGIFPTTADLDNDGDVDLVLGDMEGRIHVFKNSAGPGNPASFQLFAQRYNGIDVGAFSTPQLVDLDGDNLPELISGKENGTLSFFKNMGGPDGFSFATVADDAFWGKVDVLPACCTGYSVPHVFKSSQDSSWQLWVGSEQGFIYQYTGINTILGTQFILQDSLISGVETRGKIRVYLQDINQDGKAELFTGNLPGGCLLYTLNGNTANQDEVESNPLWIYPVPVKHQIYWEIQSIAEVEKIEVMDVTGKIVYTDYPKQNQGEIQCATLTPGIYFIQVKSGDKIYQRKFRKE
jgi:hypothetical protein